MRSGTDEGVEHRLLYCSSQLFCGFFFSSPQPLYLSIENQLKVSINLLASLFKWGPLMPAVLPFRCLFLFLFYDCCINIMLPFFLCLYRYRYTRQTKGFGCYSASPHLSRSRNSGALSLLAAFPCFSSSSYGRSRWLLIG